jgi:hypothetical protein
MKTQLISLDKFMYKKEFSKRYGIPLRTLRNYLNVRYFTELEKMGYFRLQRVLTPKQVSWCKFRSN